MTQPRPLSQAARDALARVFPAEVTAAVSSVLRVDAKGDDTYELLIYGNIGASWWDEDSVSAKDVVSALQDITAKTINVRINSDGGSVKDGVAIHNELRRQAASGVAVNTFVDSAAYSIASYIAAAGDTTTMYANAMQMLHAPSVQLYLAGNEKQLDEVYTEIKEWLQYYGRSMAKGYARKTGKPEDEFLAMWKSGKDHKFDAAEAKAFGLCDAVLDADPAIEPAPEARTAAHATATHSPATASASQAAPSAAITEEEPPMADTKKPADTHDAAAVLSPTALAAAHADALSGIRARNTDIRAMAEPHFGIPEVKAYYDDVIAAADPSTTAADVGSRILAILAKDREPLNGGGYVRASGGDNRKGQREAMSNAIEARAGLAQADGANPYRGESLIEIARACAEQVGVNTRGMSRMDVVATAITHTTSDFPGLVGSVAERSLMRGYTELELDIAQISRPITLTDFRATNPVGLGSFSDLDKVPESGEYKYGTFSSRNGLPLRAVTYGKLFSVSRQAIINDDIGLLTDVPFKMGQAAKRTLVKELFALLISNPTLPDGLPLFHADRGNLLTAAAISTGSVDAMRVAMATIQDADDNFVGVQLANLLVPTALGGLARSVRASEYVIDAGAPESRQPNYVQNTFGVVDSARLSGTAWYGLANSSQQDGLVVGYLDGKQTPYMEQEKTFTVDGVAWKVRLDAGVGIGDPMGLAKNPGA